MKVAFVGVKRKYQELAPEYRSSFDRFHLELPYYYFRDGRNNVTITTVDHESEGFPGVEQTDLFGGNLRHVLESNFQKDQYDVVVHWRKWFPEFYQPDALNLLNCQDHSFGPEWQEKASSAFKRCQLYGILCFSTWHKRNLLKECPWLPEDQALDGVTLGVDTDVYKPAQDKDPFHMLWASDLGRGFHLAAELALRVFQQDHRFRLHVCYPDNSAWGTIIPNHPVFVNHGQIPAGPELFELFGKTGILPYTSTFMEPSSRAHRQAQAAGSLVLYPHARGSPSELIESGKTGIVADTGEWVDAIRALVHSGKWKEIGAQAREMAVKENWAVQAQRFNELCRKIRGDT
ncbi:MAG: glycosyltransferase family protein [Acidiferrobacterales bacterium]